MATFTGGITNLGLGLIDQQGTGSGQITITSVKTGSGVPGGGLTYQTMTALTALVQTLTIDSANALVNYQTTFRFTVSSATVGTAYVLSEVGVFAQIGGGAPILFAYYNAGGPGDLTNPGDSISATTGGSPIFYEYGMFLEYNQATNTSVIVTFTTTVQLHAATHLDNGIDPIPLASTARTGMVPANPNDITQVLCGSNPITWNPGMLVIRSNITLNVFLGAPDIYPNFSNLQNALNYLNPYFIVPGVTVTISISAGLWRNSAPITIQHPNASQISIIGTAGAGIPITGASASGAFITVTGASGDFSSMVPGSFFLLLDALGIPGLPIRGVWFVTSNTNNSITFGISVPVALPSLAPVSSGTIIPLQTVIQFASGGQGIQCSSVSGLGNISNICLFGQANGTTQIYGLQCSNGLTIGSQIGSYGWTDNSGASCGFLVKTSGSVSFSNCAANACSNGFYTQGFACSMACNACVANANSIGWRAEGAVINFVNCYASENSLAAFLSSNMGDMFFANIYGWYNGIGIEVAYNSHAACGGTVGAGNFGGNSTIDVNMQILSSLVREGTVAITYGTTNLTPNTLSTSGITSGCYFSP